MPIWKHWMGRKPHGIRVWTTLTKKYATTVDKCTLGPEWTPFNDLWCDYDALVSWTQQPLKRKVIRCRSCHLRTRNWGWRSAETTEFHIRPEDVLMRSDWRFPTSSGQVFITSHALSQTTTTEGRLKEWDESFIWSASRMSAPIQNQIYGYVRLILSCLLCKLSISKEAELKSNM